LVQIIGWILCFKVTYLYYRVNTSSPGAPNQIPRLEEKASSRAGSRSVSRKLDDKLPVNGEITSTYSADIAEILRYSSIATSDFETFENAMA